MSEETKVENHTVVALFSPGPMPVLLIELTPDLWVSPDHIASFGKHGVGTRIFMKHGGFYDIDGATPSGISRQIQARIDDLLNAMSKIGVL